MKFIKVFLILIFSLVFCVKSFAYDLIFPEFNSERPLKNKDFIILQQQGYAEQVESMYEIALRNYYGYTRRLDKHFEVDYKEALKWLHKSYSKGKKDAAFFLGECYYYARGTKQDFNKAIYYFKKASKNNIYQANLMLSLISYDLYKQSDKLEFYKKEYLQDAKTLTKKEIEMKDPISLYNLSVMKIETEKNTIDLNDEIAILLKNSVEKFTDLNKREEALMALKILKERDLKTRRESRQYFNKVFFNHSPVNLDSGLRIDF